MICPLMSRPVMTECSDRGEVYHRTEFYEVDCKEGECAWWNAEYEQCAIRSIDDLLDQINAEGIEIYEPEDCEDCDTCDCDFDEDEH